jgi:hypothetical protein
LPRVDERLAEHGDPEDIERLAAGKPLCEITQGAG